MKIPLSFQCNEYFTNKEGYPGLILFLSSHRDSDNKRVTAAFINLELEGAVMKKMSQINSSAICYIVDLDTDGFLPSSGFNVPSSRNKVKLGSGNLMNGFYNNGPPSSDKKRKVMMNFFTNNVPSTIVPNAGGSKSGGDEDDTMDGHDSNSI